MDFLTICQRAASECGISGTISSVAGNIGSAGRIVNWVGDSWNDIQIKYDDWIWMRSSNIFGQGVSFATVAGQATYPLGTGPGTVGILPDNFGKWDAQAFRNYTTTVGVSSEMFLDPIPFDTWRNSYMLGAMRLVQTRPTAIAVGSDQSLNLGPPSNGLYTVTGDYYVAPSVMALDTDIPVGLPTRFHMLIVYKTMQKYAGYESAPEVKMAADDAYNAMLGKLEAVRASTITFGGALA